MSATGRMPLGDVEDRTTVFLVRQECGGLAAFLDCAGTVGRVWARASAEKGDAPSPAEERACLVTLLRRTADDLEAR